ncbi:hypothetical protein BgiBS90_029895 [Biomphalaria glabrata]|nr:hypothetical protein BgiMline_030906 [Biomphalaria glabrata]KAI8764510.1 hypothetical protein BgiBS90_029895 [Biomphalaria glabrata]
MLFFMSIEMFYPKPSSFTSHLNTKCHVSTPSVTSQHKVSRLNTKCHVSTPGATSQHQMSRHGSRKCLIKKTT